MKKILKDMVLWFALHMIVVYVCHKAPDSIYEKKDHWFRLLDLEDEGHFYDRIFRIKKWKDILPDGGQINTYGFEKNKIRKDIEFVRKFYLETKRAEAIHWGGMMTSFLFLLVHPFPVSIVVLGFAWILDIPFIMIQRYNRPRLGNLLRMMEDRYEAKKNR